MANSPATLESVAAEACFQMRMYLASFLTTEARRSFDQYGTDTARGVTTTALIPSERALETKWLISAEGGKAKMTS
jgi:hypothetical protein